VGESGLYNLAGKSGTSTVWKIFSTAWIPFSMLWKNARKSFHSVEVPDFSPQRAQGNRATTESFDPCNAKGARGAKDANADPNSRVLAKDAENAKELSLGDAAGGS
jgi:hypothetical protein